MIVALDEFGTLKLADVLQPAIELAEAFPIDELRVQYIRNTRSIIEQWPETAAIFFAQRRSAEGRRYFALNLAKSLREIVAAEQKNTKRGRHAALLAARDHFYRGPLGKRYCDAIEKAGGLLRTSDSRHLMRISRSADENDISIRLRNLQGSVSGRRGRGDVAGTKSTGKLRPESAETQFARLHSHAGRSDQARVCGSGSVLRRPGCSAGGELLSKDYAAVRRTLIDPKMASLDQRPGDPVNYKALAQLISLGRHRPLRHAGSRTRTRHNLV
ncbi:MAG: gamma-glutamyltransferase [Blastocatellia bacterium]